MYGSYYEKYYVLDREQNLWFAKILHLDDLKPFSFDPEGQVLEAEIAPLLSHRNLCRFGASGTMEKEGHRLLYIISEVAHGDSLSDLIHRKETLTGDELMQVMESLLSALESLHSQSRPIIHNGITPEKIRAWRREFGSLRLIGLSRARFSDLAPDPSSWHGQDLHYVAPERLEGGGSVRSDIFSAAAVMYELVFGARPWESELTGSTPERQAELFNEKRRSPLPIPSSRLIDIDEAKLAALRRALSLIRRSASHRQRSSLRRSVEMPRPQGAGRSVLRRTDPQTKRLQFLTQSLRRCRRRQRRRLLSRTALRGRALPMSPAWRTSRR